MPSPEWPSTEDAPDLSPHRVHVWRFALTVPEPRCAALRALLADDERARAESFVFPHLRERHIVARGTMRTLLGRYLRQEPARLRFGYGPHGKPFLEQAQEDLAFNLAHSDDLALLAVARGRAVGVDVERMTTRRACVEIAERFFAPAEVAAFRALPPAQQEQGFFNGWTRKEAYIKALGTGLSLPLDQFVVSLAPSVPATLLETAWDPADAARWSMRALQPGAGYAGALVAAGQDWDVACFALA